MPIQEENIVFLKSQVLDDVPEGGGAATGVVVQDGALNNVFEDISDLDRAYGRFNLRKLFVGVRSLDTDLYGGAKLAITALPTDPALGYTIFSTEDAFDQRTAAADRVESYLYKGPMWQGVMYENHIAGMRAIRVVQRVDTVLPPIGKTLCLVQDESEAGEIEQYVRVTQVDVVETAFTDDRGDYTRWVVTLSLSDALRFDFDGHTPNRTDSYNYTDKVRLRDSTVADATRYYGSRPVALSAVIGDVQIRAESMFAQLVPSARTELPLSNQMMAGVVSVDVDAGNGHIVSIPQVVQSLFRQVTAENRRLNWIETLPIIPAPGTLNCSFMAQGNWYLLQDNGDGTISGSDKSIGAGTINYATRTVTITLGALPDAGSLVLFLWGTSIHYSQRLTADVSPPVWSYLLGADDLTGETLFAIEPGSVTITWVAGGVTKTLTDDDFLLVGDGYGAIDYATGRMWFRPAVLPDPLTTPQVAYERATTHAESFTPTKDGNGFVTLNLANTPIRAGTLSLEYQTIRSETMTERATGELSQVSYFAGSSSYSASTSLSESESWSKPQSQRWVAE